MVGVLAWGMPTPIAPTRVSKRQRAELEKLVRSRTTEQRIVERCRIVLLSADGYANAEIAREVGVARDTVILWRKRFEQGHVKALLADAPRSGRPVTVAADKIAKIVDETQHLKPADATHWSTRTMARRHRVSKNTVNRIWQANGLKPHLIRTFKISTDPQFTEKLRDVVGLYLAPPDRAIVFSVDEKSQVQALDRTQASLPMKKGRAGTMTHDYKRNGTTTLFAALNVLDGRIIHKCMPRHRHQEFLAFLKVLDAESPAGVELHLILDNYGTHKHPAVKKWLARRPKRFHLHFTPTSSSWLNLVERFFAEITRKRIRRGVFASVPALIADIDEYITIHNQDPKPYVWTAKANEIIKKVNKCREILRTLH